MANGKYTGVGYRPLRGDVTNDILNAENAEFRHRREARIEEDRAQRARDLKQAKAMQGLKRAKGLKLYDTGSETLNETIAEAVTIATNEYPKIYEILDDTTGKYSQKDKIKAKLKLDNIYNLPENLKTMTNAVMGEYGNYQKGVASGGLFRDTDYEDKFANGYKGVSISLDDNGLPIAIFRRGERDVNNDGVIDDRDIETMDSLNDVYSRPQFQRNFDYDAMVAQHASKLESAVNTTTNGFKETTVTGVEPELLQSTVKRFLYNDDGSPRDTMRAFVRQRGMDIDNPDHLAQVELDYMTDIFLRTKRGREEDFNASAFVSNKRENRLAQEEQAERIVVDFDEQLVKDDFNNRSLKQDKVNGKMISVPEGQIKFKNLGGKDSELNEGFVTGFALEKDGTVIVTGKALKTKNAKIKVGNDIMSVVKAKKMAENGNVQAQSALDNYTVPNNYGRFIRKVSGTELGSFASKAGYESVDALRQELESINTTSNTNDDFDWSNQ